VKNLTSEGIEAQRQRVEEIRQALGGCPINLVYDDEGILVVEIPDEVAASKMIYDILWVDSKGRVAQAMINHPTYYSSMEALLKGIIKNEVQVVFDVETHASPYPLGLFIGTDEDVIKYDTGTEIKEAPADCVRIVRVIV
jgi:hypothetical protein